jgi:hypothetical protein
LGKSAPWLACASALCILSNSAPAQKLKLLPTSVTQQQIREFHSRLDDVALNEAQRDATFNHAQARISEFIIAQPEAEPRLEPRHLCDELVLILEEKMRRSQARSATAGPDPTRKITWGSWATASWSCPTS